MFDDWTLHRYAGAWSWLAHMAPEPDTTSAPTIGTDTAHRLQDELNARGKHGRFRRRDIDKILATINSADTEYLVRRELAALAAWAHRQHPSSTYLLAPTPDNTEGDRP